MKLGFRKNASTLLALILAVALSSCTGDTDGGSGADKAQTSDPYVDNGGSGAKIELEIEAPDNSIAVAERAGFRVRVTDPQGQPLEFVRILCDTERGVAILEPTTGVESTSARGVMSGVIGGSLPGSFVMECRAQTGFNLVDRVSVRVTGDVPAGFTGFTGAAGGTLGGGVVVDGPTVDDGNGVRITSVAVTDAGTTATNSGPLDIVRNGCRSGSGSSATCVAEPFVFNTFTVNIANDTTEAVFINTVEVRLGSRTVVSAQGNPTEIAKGSTGSIKGTLTSTSLVNCAADKCYNTGGSNSVSITPGTRNHTFIVTGVSKSGDSFEVSRSAAIQFDAVNNCTAGATAGAVCSN